MDYQKGALIKVEKILGYFINSKSIHHCITDIMLCIEKGGKPKYLVCANSHSLAIAKNDINFDKALKNADFVVPDGIGIIIASKILGGKITERITGSDIFLNVSQVLNKKNICLKKKSKYSYFFLGSTNKNLKKLICKINDMFPNINIAGTYSPPFKPEFTDLDNRLIIDKINKAKPDVLWVGMTAPKQEKWIFMNRNKLDVKFIGAIGAVFDFYTGTVKRSHPWFQKYGLEWLPRLIRQPRRLWRRNLVSNPLFLLRIVEQRYMSKRFRNIN